MQKSLILPIAWSVEVVHPNESVLPPPPFAGPLHSTEAVAGLMPIIGQGWNFKKISANSSLLS